MGSLSLLIRGKEEDESSLVERVSIEQVIAMLCEVKSAKARSGLLPSAGSAAKLETYLDNVVSF
jgi:hypothetical protein